MSISGFSLYLANGMYIRVDCEMKGTTVKGKGNKPGERASLATEASKYAEKKGIL